MITKVPDSVVAQEPPPQPNHVQDFVRRKLKMKDGWKRGHGGWYPSSLPNQEQPTQAACHVKLKAVQAPEQKKHKPSKEGREQVPAGAGKLKARQNPHYEHKMIM